MTDVRRVVVLEAENAELRRQVAKLDGSLHRRWADNDETNLAGS